MPEGGPSIAVLPFADMSPGKDQEHLADGVAEEILNALSHVPGLRVVGRTSSFSFKGKADDLRTIGAKLGAATILEGSVRRDGERIRVAVQLAKAADGYQIWSESYDRALGSIFDVQDEIARAVVRSLELTLLPGNGGARERPSLEVHAKVLLGKQLLRKGSLDGFRGAERAFREAIAADSRYPLAQVGLSEALWGRYRAGDSRSAEETEQICRETVAAAERAAELAPDLAEAISARGAVRAGFLWDWAGSLEDHERALALNGNAPDTLRSYGFLLGRLGRMHAAVASLKRAAELDPLSAETQRLLGYVLMAAGELAPARRALDQALEIAPSSDWALQFRATCWLQEGRAGEALATMERSGTEGWRLWGRALANHSLGSEPESRQALEAVIECWAHVGTYQIAQIVAWRGEREHAFEWLERCYREHDVGLTYLKLDRLMVGLRDDPRWNDLLRRMNLPVDPAPQPEPPGSAEPAGLRPGSLSALLVELARAPESGAGDAWAQALRPGLLIGKFELVREIGSGGFGVVWEARDRELGRKVAFKAVRAGGKAAIREERLLREAEAAARLTHPNIVTLHDLGRSAQGPYLVLELLHGRTLEERLEQGRLSVREAVRIATEVAKGLAHAHGQGVVHRDLKPANVFLCDDGQVKVLDFGLAHAFGQLRPDGGTPAYMAPEQWEGAPEDERTDVFALGVLLFRMLSGELPFPEDGGKAIVGSRRAPALEVSELPALGELVGRTLERSPVARPRHGGEVAAALQALQQELERAPATGSAPVTTRPRTGLAGLLSELKRRRVVPALVAYATFALIALRGVDWLAQTGRLPAWVLAAALALLGLGLPVSLFLAWTYDLTGQGIRKTESPRAPRGPARAGRIRLALVLAGLGLLAAVPGAIYYLGFRETGRELASGPDGRIAVAVADFANQTGEPALDALSGLLITSLEQSRRLKVLTRARMLDLLRQLGREKLERIDEAAARQVGLKAGVRALLLASIQKMGQSYVVELRAIDPQKDHYLFALRDQASDQASILALLDRLSERTRLRLQESDSGVKASAVQLASAVTPNLEAYRHYFRGKELSARMDTRGALKEFGQAIALEPRFALAQYELALNAFFETGSGKETIREAARNAIGAPEKESGLIGALDAFTARRFREAVANAIRLSARFPDDPDVATLAAVVVELTGDYQGTLPLLERIVSLRPENRMMQVEHIYVLHALGRADEARVAAGDLLRRDPSPGSRVVGAVERTLRGELEGAIADFEAAGAAGTWATWFHAQSLAAIGRSREALRVLGTERYHQLDAERAIVVAYAGRLREGRDLLRAAARNPAADAEQMNWIASLYLNAAGDREGARQLAPVKDLAPAYDMLGHFESGDDARLLAVRDEVSPASLGGRLLEALLSWRAGRKTDALARLRELDRTAEWFVPYYRGRLAAEMGLHEEAIEALGRFMGPVLIEADAVVHPWLQARARIQLARSLEALGRRDEARKAIVLQLHRWGAADADLPLLLEARELHVRLARPPASGTTQAAARAPGPSIAVLPFADMSPGKDQEYFADGVAEEILNTLMHVQGLKVVGRTSSFSFKGKEDDLKLIGRKLGVTHVVEGSVRKDGGRVRVSAQLVKSEDGFQLWSETYDRELTGILAAQDDIARAVASAFSVRLVSGTELGSRAGQTAFPEARDQYLLGLHYSRIGTPDDFRRAEAALTRAVAIDPAYARAQAALSDAIWGRYSTSDATDATETRRLQERALGAAERAVQLAPTLAEAYRARGAIRRKFLWDWPGATADLERARAIHADDPDTLWNLGLHRAMLGSLPEAIGLLRRATELDPLSAEAWRWLGWAHLCAGEQASARRALLRAVDIAPGHVWARAFLATSYLAEGDAATALATTEGASSEGRRLWGRALAHHTLGHAELAKQVLDSYEASKGHIAAFQIAEIHAWRGERDAAFEWLERCFRDRDAGLTLLTLDPLLRDLHVDPRWKGLLRKLNLPVD